MKIQGSFDGRSGASRESDVGLLISASRERRGSARPTYTRSVGVGSHRSTESGAGQVDPMVSQREEDRSVYPNSCPPTPESDGVPANVLA